MSAFVVSHEQINLLVSAMIDHNIITKESGFLMARELLEENIRAVNYCYKYSGSSQMIAAENLKILENFTFRIDNSQVYFPETIKSCCDCYLYQISEGEELYYTNTKAYVAASKLQNTLVANSNK